MSITHHLHHLLHQHLFSGYNSPFTPSPSPSYHISIYPHLFHHHYLLPSPSSYLIMYISHHVLHHHLHPPSYVYKSPCPQSS
jgi:hypothetical protein